MERAVARGKKKKKRRAYERKGGKWTERKSMRQRILVEGEVGRMH